jgi:hypothetical protein
MFSVVQSFPLGCPMLSETGTCCPVKCPGHHLTWLPCMGSRAPLYVDVLCCPGPLLYLTPVSCRAPPGCPALSRVLRTWMSFFVQGPIYPAFLCCQGPNLPGCPGLCPGPSLPGCAGLCPGPSLPGCPGLCPGPSLPGCPGLCPGPNLPVCPGLCPGPNLPVCQVLSRANLPGCPVVSRAQFTWLSWVVSTTGQWRKADDST